MGKKSMSDTYFIDTNIWLYGFMKEDERHKTASLLIAGDNIVLSTQVLNEISYNLVNKCDYTEEEIVKFVKNMYRKFDVLKPNEENILVASVIRTKYAIDFWESMKVAAALKHGCKVMFSDKQEDGRMIEGTLKLINPF